MRGSELIFACAVLAGSHSFASAQIHSGKAIAVDGDTIILGEVRVRLVGIDAPEASQICRRDGHEWQCGAEATALLTALLERGQTECRQVGRDVYQRALAACKVGTLGLAEMMVGSGLAIVTDEGDSSLLDLQNEARSARRGVWAGTFQIPSEFRAANPSLFRAPIPSPPARRESATPPSRTVFYRNCREARAAGVAPIYRGQPGYRPEMDGDGDGIACEPYRGR